MIGAMAPDAIAALVQRLAAMPAADRRALLSTLPAESLQELRYHWPAWARSDQLMPKRSFRNWLLMGGRGCGKTRTGSETVRGEVESGRRRQVGIVGPTADAVRRVQVEGPSGILACSRDDMRPTYEPSTRRLLWPNGAVAHLFSAEEPDRLRGPNLDFAWADEITSWYDPEAAWTMLQMALRLEGTDGSPACCVVSTTPKPLPLLKKIIASPSTVITRARTMDNVGNLDAATLAYLRERYGGTTMGRQELDGELIEDLEGALWSRAILDACRVTAAPDAFRRVVVAVDPAGGSSRSNAETGIVAAGRAADGQGYILSDLSGRYTPDGWARQAVGLYRTLQADRIVCEQNFGGAMVEATIRAVDPAVPVKMVTASRGKAVRAEPVVALYEQRRVHHVGNLPELEDQLCGWDPLESGPSPDRLDALVWAVSELLVEPQAQPARFLRLNWIER